MNQEVKYHVWYKEKEFGFHVEDNNDGYEDYHTARSLFEFKKHSCCWATLEKVTTEVLEVYEEPYPFEHGEKVKIIKEGLLYHAEGIVWQYNKSHDDVTVFFENDDLKVDFEINEIVKI